MTNFIENPFETLEEAAPYTNEQGVTTVTVLIDFETMLIANYEMNLDLMDTAIVGSNVDFSLTDISFELVGAQDGAALVQVTGVLDPAY